MLEVISHDYFSVKFQKFFDQTCTNIVKGFRTKGKDTVVYDPERKVWNIRFEEYKEAEKAI